MADMTASAYSPMRLELRVPSERLCGSAELLELIVREFAEFLNAVSHEELLESRGFARTSDRGALRL